MLPGNHGNDFRIELVWSFKFKTNLMKLSFGRGAGGRGGGGVGGGLCSLPNYYALQSAIFKRGFSTILKVKFSCSV